MADPAVDKFGELVVRQLRDNSIEHFDQLAAQHSKAPSLLELQDGLSKLSPETRELVRKCVISCIDTGLHDLLFGLVEANECEEGIAVIVDGINIAEASDGLNGEQFSDSGWIARFGAYDEKGTLKK